MRLFALLMALLLLPAAAGQMDFGNPHQVRIAHGDIPSTNLVEDDGRWNFQQLFVVPEGNSTEWALPAGHTFVAAGCNGCSSSADLANAPDYTFTCVDADPNGDGGSCPITVTHSLPGDATSFGASVLLRDGSIVVLYTAVGAHVHAAMDPITELNCTADPCKLHQYNTGGLDSFWFTVAPSAPQSTAVAPAETGFGVMELLVGLLVGAAAWYLLVRLGYVQKRQRKQVVAEAAHKHVAKQENKPTLEGRKRALMAALKELEVAKMNKELDTDAYDALKADFKKETVTVMRALEEAS